MRKLALLTSETDKASGNIFSSFSAGLTAGVCITRNDATHDGKLTISNVGFRLGRVGRHHRHVGMILAGLKCVHTMSVDLTRSARSPIRFQPHGPLLGCFRPLSCGPK